MQNKATTPKQYLAALPADRQSCLEAVLAVIRHNLDPAYEEGMQYGMIGFYVPHRIFPAGYHTDAKQPLPFAALASQKNYMSLYLMGLYVDPDGNSLTQWFRSEWAKTGKKLDMGKSCIRFKRRDDLALEVIGEAIRRMPAQTYIAQYQAALGRMKSNAKVSTKSAAKANSTSAART